MATATSEQKGTGLHEALAEGRLTDGLGGGHRDQSPGLGVGRGIREGGGLLCEVLGTSLWPQFLYHVLPGVSNSCSVLLEADAHPCPQRNVEQGAGVVIYHLLREAPVEEDTC